MITLMELKSSEFSSHVSHTAIMDRVDTCCENQNDLTLSYYELKQITNVATKFISNYLKSNEIHTFPPGNQTQNCLENKIK